MKKIHELLVPFTFFWFIFSLIIYFVWGVLFKQPNEVHYIFFVPSMILVCILLGWTGVSRLLDERYETLFRKKKVEEIMQ